MMKRNKITALLYFITSLLFYVSAILNFTSDVGMQAKDKRFKPSLGVEEE